MYGLSKRVDVDRPAVGVQGRLTGSGSGRQLNADVLLSSIDSSSSAPRIVVDRAHLRDRIPQPVQLLEDRDDVGDHVLVHDQLAAVRLPVESEVVDLDPAQQLGSDGAARPPRRAELGGGDRMDGRRRAVGDGAVAGESGAGVDRSSWWRGSVAVRGSGARIAAGWHAVASTTAMAIRR